MKKFSNVAPKSLIRKDFDHLNTTVHLIVNDKVKPLILIQSIEGHAHEGHSVFRGEKFPNTCMEDIVLALNMDVDVIKGERQKLIDDIREWFLSLKEEDLDNRKPLLNSFGEPLLGITMFENMQVSVKSAVFGYVLAGLMDDIEYRKKAEAKYKVNIGGGDIYIVDRTKMEELKITGDMLAKEENEKNIEEYKRNGLIVSSDRVLPGSNIIVSHYIRHKKGPGLSDDAALLSAGFLSIFKKRDVSALIGAFLADSVDTLDKFSDRIVELGQDEELAFELISKFKQFDLREDLLLKFIYLASIPEDMKGNVPDSSMRHFLQKDEKVKISELESHISFLRGEEVPSIILAFQEVPSHKFYNYYNNRLKELGI